VPVAAEHRTARLLLRQWRDEDRDAFAAMNADPAVMEHFPGPLDRAASDAFLDRMRDQLAAEGWGLWAVEVTVGARAGTAAAGYVGLWPADFVAPGTVEVGWRLRHEAWGHGYAPEGAREALRVGFAELGLAEIVSFTVPQNANSRRVMAKIGMHHDPSRDFDHPRVDPRTHPHLVRHVMYVLRADEHAQRR
jgi:RimJ/RimL family protein N-acetyltransferase